MKKILLSAGFLSVMALTGCDTFNKDTPETPPEPTESTMKVTPEEGATPIVEESEVSPEATEVVTEEEVTQLEEPVIKIDTIEVTAKQLGRDYDIDSYRADKLYKDKALTVTGEVDNIFISASADKAIVFLKTENDQIPAMASGDAAFATRVKDLKISETVELLCEGTEAVSKAPVVNGCVVL